MDRGRQPVYAGTDGHALNTPCRIRYSVAESAASVPADGRLCIPRVAFEALAFETGNPVVGGVPLGVTVDGSSSVKIFPDVADGDTPVNPTTDRLRMHLRIPNLKVGDHYDILVSTTGLTIQL